MVTMHPFAFIAANAASLVSSASNTAAVKREVGLHKHKAAASGFAEEQQLSSTSAPESKAPINLLLGADTENSLPDHDIPPITSNSSPLHFIFIVHGHQGRPTDLSYLHHTIRTKAKEKGKFVNVTSSESCAVGRITEVRSAQNNSPLKIRRRKRDRLPMQVERAFDLHDNDQLDSKVVRSNETEQTRGYLIVHNAACNEGKTHDGIIKGGERLVDEMLSVIRSEVKRREQTSHRERAPIDVTISFVGNSLGGLYARYATAHLAEILDKESSNNYYLFDGFIRLHFNVFCSTASPHLGCASFTFIPIPRTAEMGVAQVMGETGSDLFRLNDLIHSMATAPRFLVPLASYRRRIAYANAFGTDFPVPCSTAAFLDKESDYPHYFGETFAEGDIIAKDTCPASERGLIAATLYTMPQDTNFETESTSVDDTAAMSACLDSLGWKKVFIDIRKEIPSVPILKSNRMECPVSQLKSSSTEVRSCDLDRVLSSSSIHRLSLPMGHNAICAFSRGKVSSIVNSGGRPVMDSLALDLADAISSWDGINQ